jgi:hypothetical protein
MRLAGIVVLAAAALTAAGAAAAGTSNVRGSVVRGPVTPVCRVDVSCSAPVPGLPLVFFTSGVEVARVKTDAMGHFALSLAPGSYQVKTTRRLAFGGPVPRTFRVLGGQTTRLRLLIDTEIRVPIGGRPAS